MADLKEFDKLLSSTITAPRLSGSKVQKLATLSSELVLEDHHIVTTFFKLNASLPPSSQSRISSLYVFDAIAREAKSQVNKGIGTQVNKERGKGTQAGLLLKLEGVVDSWIEGALDDGKGGLWIEGKEKTKKIVDIWLKAGTFPQHCLERLSKKITNAGSQAGPSTTPSMLGGVGRTESTGSAGKGSTTPPYPPPSTTPAGSLPPEIAKLLGISQQANPSPPANHVTLPSNGANPNPPPLIPTMDLAAILASVNKPLILNTNDHFGSNTINQQPSISNIPNLSNLSSLLPQNVFPPSASSNLPIQQNQFGNNSQAGPSSNAIPIGNSTLNSTQSAALAKFASLAQAGPPPPLPQHDQQGPPRVYNQGQDGSHNSFNNREHREQDGRRNDTEFIPRRSPQKNFNNLPSIVPEGMRAEPMRGPIPPPHRSNERDRGFQGPGGRGNGRRESNDRNNDWGRRGSYEHNDTGPNFGGGRGGGGDGGGRGGRRNGGGRDRSRSPNREQKFDRPSDNGWGNRNQRGEGGHRGRGGFMGNNNGTGHHPRGQGQGQIFDGNRNNQFPPGQGRGFENTGNTQLPPGPSNSQPQFGHGNPPFPPNMGAQFKNDFKPDTGLPINPSLPTGVVNGLPPRPMTDIPTSAPMPQGSNGRAPPPSWMEERSDPSKADQGNGKKEGEEQGDGETDITLDESDNENSATKPNTVSQYPNQSQIQPDLSSRYPIHDNSQQQQQQQSRLRNPNFPQSQESILTLETFPINTFNPSLPESWSNLAQAWKNSMGRDPNQMELMAFLAGGMGMGNLNGNGNSNDNDNNDGLGMGMGMDRGEGSG